MTYLFGWMSLLFTGLVSVISSVVSLYTYDNMSGAFSINRLIMLFLVFVVSMVLLTVSPS
jgi:NADH:ubiquinone oxidoreductase subunit 5 (subunit L)/multisubunit Na+/H+ antiporter MnhA subunit